LATVNSSKSSPPAKSSKDITFPKVDRIMGLPPIGAETDGEYFDTRSFLEVTFPILHIIASACEWENITKPMNVKKLSQEYQFAVIPDTSISYSHTNNYYASNIEQDLANLIRLNTAGEIRQLALVSKGPTGQAFSGVGVAYLDELIRQMTDVLQTYGARIGGNAAQLYTALGADVSRTFLGGGRIDIPNIWEDSNTAMSWTFTIDLRTFATDPNSEMYFRDIIQPLEVLLKLSLPVGGYNISYLEPPYISARLGNIMDVKLGGISSLSWSAPLNEFNFNEVPRHIEVSITIQDLYNVMVQSGSENPDFPSAEKFITNMSRNYKNRMQGKAFTKVFSKEYDIKMGSAAEEASDVSSAMKQPNYSSISQPAIPSAQVKDFNMKKLFNNPILTNVTTKFDRLRKSISIKSEYTNTIFKLDNVKNVTGNMITYDFVNGNPLNFNMNNISKFTVSGNNMLNNLLFSGLEGNMLSMIQDVFNPSSMLHFTNNLFSQVPNTTLNELAIIQAILTRELGGFINESGSNIGTLISVLSNITRGMSYKLPSIINNETITPESIVASSLKRIKENDIILDNQIKYSIDAQRYLQHAAEEFARRFGNNPNVTNEIRTIAMGKDLGSFVDAMSNVFDTVSVITSSSILNEILKPQLNGIESDITIVMEA